MSDKDQLLPIAEILCFGNELLNGRTVNTNASFIGKHLTIAGFHVSRITTSEDSREVAIAVIKEILERDPSILIITGGLGPTWDDVTSECLASALDRPLKRNTKAEEFMKEAYKKFKLEIKNEANKMTDLPKDAEAIYNPVGTAPGIHVVENSCEIFALPGVPSEMKSMITEQVIPLIRGKSKSFFFEKTFFVESIPESYLAETIKQVRDDFYPIWVKSHPMGTEGEPLIEFQLTLHSQDESESQLVDQACEKLKLLISEKFKDSKITEKKQD